MLKRFIATLRHRVAWFSALFTSPLPEDLPRPITLYCKQCGRGELVPGNTFASRHTYLCTLCRQSKEAHNGN